ncbi:hypothetical protein [Rhodococcus rhodochrous]|jgi:hypothetical protein|uniref:Uncharacterized protein n=1 Tax=Rhodococcus rhodochrous TaxID=1829 RepID=A0AA46WSL1_RHORH|nr:hypothetical protein [Rhodococcus rhodochrous]MCB8909216.1 hypothetical protein [Rhodococcus rhodochrous]UZF43579.1 hypothetical protein KUM34_016995 [Rhodococcus rhodochrous]
MLDHLLRCSTDSSGRHGAAVPSGAQSPDADDQRGNGPESSDTRADNAQRCDLFASGGHLGGHLVDRLIVEFQVAIENGYPVGASAVVAR